jgi:hypothetical protein
VPDTLLAPLHRALQADLAWAVQHATPAASAASFKFEHAIAIVRCERADATPPPAGNGGKAAGAGKAGGGAGAKRPKGAAAGAAAAAASGGGGGGASELVALRADDELLRRGALLAFPIASRLPARGRTPTRLLALLLTAEALKALPDKLDALEAEETRRAAR